MYGAEAGTFFVFLTGTSSSLTGYRPGALTVDMTDAEECAERLRKLAAEPDTPEARKKIDAWIDVYRVDGGVRADLAAAFETGDVPDTTLTAFIRARLASEVG
jgi:hypothetical protein